MTRFAIASLVFGLGLGFGGCFQSHPSGQQELMGTDCYSCHTTDYAGTTAPVHRDAPQVFSTSCASCHRTVGWQPALEGLHSEVFGIARGAHAGIACLGCHDLAAAQPSKLGANTNCLQCHPDDATQREGHVGVTMLTGEPYRYLVGVANFCLACQPAGTADVHPDNKFARTRDHAVPCEQCHDRTAGPDSKGANVTCVSGATVSSISDIKAASSGPVPGARHKAAPEKSASTLTKTPPAAAPPSFARLQSSRRNSSQCIPNIRRPPRASQATTTTSMPTIAAEAGLVPCAEEGIRHTLRCGSPRAA